MSSGEEDETIGVYGWRCDGRFLGVPQPNGIPMLIDLAVPETSGLRESGVRAVSRECLTRDKDGELNSAVLMLGAETLFPGRSNEPSEGLTSPCVDVVFLTLLTLRRSSDSDVIVSSEISSGSS